MQLRPFIITWLALLAGACKPSAPSPLAGARLSAVPNVSMMAKGVGDFSGNGSRIDGLGASWYYNWTPRATGGTKAEFVPMIWGDRDVSDSTFADIKNSSATAVLGFNEPDQASGDQSGMAVGHAAAIWSAHIVNIGKRRGSPAATNYDDGGWFDQFMQAVGPSTVDFIAMHHYAYGTTDPAAGVAQYRDMLTKMHAKYNKPIWLTEFGAPGMSQQAESVFLTQVVAMMASLGYVERYAWYSTDGGKDGSSQYASCILVEDSGALTGVGTTYKSLDPGSLNGSSGVPSGLGGTTAYYQPGATPGVPIKTATTGVPVGTTPPPVAPAPGPTPGANGPWGILVGSISSIITAIQGAASTGSSSN